MILSLSVKFVLEVSSQALTVQVAIVLNKFF